MALGHRAFICSGLNVTLRAPIRRSMVPDFLPRPESSPLAALAVAATVVPETTPCEEVEAVFRCDPALRSIVVDCGSGRLVVLDRNRSAAHLAGPLGYGRAIYARRPVSALMDEPALASTASRSSTTASATVPVTSC